MQNRHEDSCGDHRWQGFIDQKYAQAEANINFQWQDHSSQESVRKSYQGSVTDCMAPIDSKRASSRKWIASRVDSMRILDNSHSNVLLSKAICQEIGRLLDQFHELFDVLDQTRGPYKPWRPGGVTRV